MRSFSAPLHGPIVQWIERRFPVPQIGVRLPVGLPAFLLDTAWMSWFSGFEVKMSCQSVDSVQITSPLNGEGLNFLIT